MLLEWLFFCEAREKSTLDAEQSFDKKCNVQASGAQSAGNPLVPEGRHGQGDDHLTNRSIE